MAQSIKSDHGQTHRKLNTGILWPNSRLCFLCFLQLHPVVSLRSQHSELYKSETELSSVLYDSQKWWYLELDCFTVCIKQFV